MRRAVMSAADLAWFYRPKKGKYRRRTPVPEVDGITARQSRKRGTPRVNSRAAPGSA